MFLGDNRFFDPSGLFAPATTYATPGSQGSALHESGTI